ncbi:MAG TPA: MotA/TolQ/ExbB proton channel family protein [Candidatus Methylacidiphilales bacterium]|nr:MotA/TolQ/ExbB proton channel family protein [Candidatus Methylacidiphilales bacterium]
MFDLLTKGGPIMWPLLATSLVAVSVVIERILFILAEKSKRDPDAVEAVLKAAEEGRLTDAQQLAERSRDFVVRAVGFALQHDQESFSNAMLRGARRELRRFSRGLSALDTIVTLAPLLGLLGTVTGMIHAFGLLGTQTLDTPTAITGGIAQALIATAFGLGIAITALIPFNYLNTQLENAREDIEEAATRLEMALKVSLQPSE